MMKYIETRLNRAIAMGAFPCNEDAAITIRDFGQKSVDEAIRRGLVIANDRWLVLLSARTRHCLNAINITNRVQAMDALLSGRLKKIRNFGRKSHLELVEALGLAGNRCQYCHEPIQQSFCAANAVNFHMPYPGKIPYRINGNSVTFSKGATLDRKALLEVARKMKESCKP